jgi:transcriptional regulator with XRE-family HTH domain
MLGDLAGLHPNYIAALERGEIDPTYFTLRRLVLALGVTMDRLVRRAEEAEREAAAAADAGGSDQPGPA